MKKIISILTVFSMLLAMMLTATVPSFAAPATEISAAAYYDENLVGWWNFEGANKTEKLADKSLGGVADNMTAQSTATFDTNGEAVMPAKSAAFLRIPNTGDITTLDGKTLYISYRAEGTSTKSSNNLIYFRQAVDGTNECIFRYTQKEVTSNFYSSVNAYIGRKSGSTGGLKGITMDTSIPDAPAAGGWYHLAISFDFDTAGNVVVNLYNSNNGSDYVKTTASIAKADGLQADLSEATLLLGCANASMDLQYTINDVRYYDAVLPEDAVAALASYTPYSQTTVDTVDGLHDANLVAYYDFEGENPFADKAPNGDHADTMKSSNVTVANGAATILADAGSYLAIPNKSADTDDLAGKTIFMKFYAEGATSTETKYANDLINSSCFRYWMAHPSTTGSYKFGGQTVVNGTTTRFDKLANATANEVPSAPAVTWYYVAITFNAAEDGLVISTYNSANGFSYVENVYQYAATESLIRTGNILIGKHSTGTAATNNRGLGFTVDELRIYDTVLSADDIAGLSTETPRESCINLLGWQDKDNGNGTQDVRFLAHLNVNEEDLAKYSAVGFKISATYKGATKEAQEISADTVYTSVIADSKEITLLDYKQINGYIIALPVWNVPTDSEVVFTVQTFYQPVGSDTPVYGEATTVTYNAA